MSIKMNLFEEKEFSMGMPNIDTRTNIVAMENANITSEGTTQLIEFPGYLSGIVVFDNSNGSADVRVELWDLNPNNADCVTNMIIVANVPAGSIYYAPYGSTKLLFYELWCTTTITSSTDLAVDLTLLIPVNY